VLDGVCSDFARRTGLEIEFSSTGSDQISDAGRVSFYRFLQETLTNVAKHARASRVRVRLDGESGFAVLSVSDDGVGFSCCGQGTGGAGLIGLRERFELLGGWIKIGSETDRGAYICAGIPITEEQETDR
jgi:signal transduction histidine kinase